MHRLAVRQDSASRRRVVTLVLGVLAAGVLVVAWRASAQAAGPTTLACTEDALHAAFAAGGDYAYAADCSLDIGAPSTLAAGKTLTIDAATHGVQYSGANQPHGTSGFATVYGTLILKGVSVRNFLSAGTNGANGATGQGGESGTDGSSSGDSGDDGGAGDNGAAGGNGTDAQGGGALTITSSGQVTLNHVEFDDNLDGGGSGGYGGEGGYGGAGGHGAAGADGQSGGMGGDGAQAGNGGNAGNGGSARGGAIDNAGSLTIVSSRFAGNRATGGSSSGSGGEGGAGGSGGDGGAGGTGAQGGGGGAAGRGGDGGNAGSVGSALGGAIYNTGTLDVSDTTWSEDVASAGNSQAGTGGYGGHGGNGVGEGEGGSGGDGGNAGSLGAPGSATGGAIYSTVPFTLSGGSTTGDRVAGGDELGDGGGTGGDAGYAGSGTPAAGHDGAATSPSVVHGTDTAPDFYPEPGMAVPVVRASSATVAEPSSGTAVVSVPVSLSQASDQTVTVHYATADGTATVAHDDYVATSGTLTFAAGQTAETVPVTVKASHLTESRTFSVVLSAPTNATVGTASATVTIATGAVISGSVDARPGRSLPGVQVKIVGAHGTQTVTTDVAGHYAAAVDPGDYTVTPQPDDGRYQPRGGGDCTVSGNGCAVTTAHSLDLRADFVAALSVDAVTFRQRAVTTNELEAVPESGTYDGNAVEVDVKLTNTAAKPLTTTVALGRPIADGAVDAPGLDGVTGAAAITVPAQGSVTMPAATWDTEGAAWTDAQAPDPDHIVRATLGLTPSYGEAQLTVRPKPVVLVNGLDSDASTWAAYVGAHGFLAGTDPDWQGFAVGDGTVPGKMNTDPIDADANTIANNADEEAVYIRGIRQRTNAWHVDLVVHSMGGLISRFYIDRLMPGNPPDGRPVVSHLVMLGTPNEGSVCATELESAILIGATRKVIEGASVPLLQLTPGFAAAFNQAVADRHGVPFSILAGNALPTTCGNATPGDGVVGLPSALWNLQDRTVVKGLLHTSMTGYAPAFGSWVRPHLALGPAAATRTVRTAGRRATLAAAGKKKHKKKKPSPCKARSGGLGAIAGGGLITATRVGTTRAFRVGAAKAMTVVLFHGPGVTATLTDPRGHVAKRLKAGTRPDAALFSSIVVKHPRAGRWRLRFVASKARHRVGFTVTQQRPTVRLTVTPVTAKGALTGLRARITRRGRHVRGVRVTARLIGAKGKPSHVRLRPVRHHPGRYAFSLSRRLRRATTSGAALVTVAGHGIHVSSLVESARACPG